MRSIILGVLFLGSFAACGSIRDPFGSLPAGACSTDDDCVIAACPNACNLGQPFCTYPPVHARADVAKACPCFGMPAMGKCAAPNPADCGPQPGCAGPFDVDQVRARCVSGMCASRFADGGVVMAP